MSETEKVIQAVLSRARLAGKRVFGYRSDKPSCERILKKVPPEFDRLCVEGDAEWTKLPWPEDE